MPDFDRAKAACVIDALRGGGDNDRGDRELAARLEEHHPGASQMLKWVDRFAAAAAVAAVAAGMAGVIFGGQGFPARVPPHRAAAARGTGTRQRDRRTWFAYASGAEAVTSERAVSLTPGEATALNAHVADPRAVLAAAGAAHLAGIPAQAAPGAVFPDPVQVQFGLTAAFLDGAEMEAVTAHWAAVLPSGSQVAVLVPLAGYLCLPELASPVPDHGPGDAAMWLEKAGLELLQPPADVRAWDRPGWDERAIKLDSLTRVVAAVGRVS